MTEVRRRGHVLTVVSFRLCSLQPGRRVVLHCRRLKGFEGSRKRGPFARPSSCVLVSWAWAERRHRRPGGSCFSAKVLGLAWRGNGTDASSRRIDRLPLPFQRRLRSRLADWNSNLIWARRTCPWSGVVTRCSNRGTSDNRVRNVRRAIVAAGSISLLVLSGLAVRCLPIEKALMSIQLRRHRAGSEHLYPIRRAVLVVGRQ